MKYMTIISDFLLKGNPSQVSFSLENLVPRNIGNIEGLVLASSVFVTLTGMEVSAVHAREVKDPQRTYPRAIFIASG